MAGVNIRELATDTLVSVLRGEDNLSRKMQEVLSNYQYLDKRDRSLYTRLCEGTTEKQIYLDYYLNHISKTPVAKCRPYIRALLRVSAYQILCMDRIPTEAAVNEAVKIAGKRGYANLKGFVNGVLRNLDRKRDEIPLPNLEKDRLAYLEVAYSMPRHLVEKIVTWYPEDAETILQAFEKEAPLTARVNLAKTTKEEVKSSLEAEGVQVSDGVYTDNSLRLSEVNYLRRLDAFREGKIVMQDESSILHGAMLQPKAEDRILDLCAAPGGKSLNAAEQLMRLGGTGEVTSCDLTENKVSLIQENMERLEAKQIKACISDATEYVKEWEEAYDMVIADLPCSGLGIMGRKPDIRYHVSEESLDSLVTLQKEIITNAVRYVKPGGYLAYSTCTLNPKENREIFDYIKETYGFTGVSLTGRLPKHLTEEVQGQPETDVEAGYVTLLPGRQQCDGFFLSLLQKRN